jgi:hypothetical protein
MLQLSARAHCVQAAFVAPASTEENLLGELTEAAKMTIRPAAFANDL